MGSLLHIRETIKQCEALLLRLLLWRIALEPRIALPNEHPYYNNENL